MAKEKILLLLIILIGGFFRFYNLNWDNNYHLHPDERFLTMVGNAMVVPETFSDYLNPQESTFNPGNIGFRFFVYGLFPVSLNKITAVLFNNDNYNDFTIQGRFISAILDTFVVLLIFGTLKLLENKYKLNIKIKYFASFLYAILVLPIQLSHFFAVDTFLNLFTFASFFFALNYWVTKKKFFLIAAGILIGLGIASKITAVFILPLIAVLIIIFKKKDIKFSLLNSILNLFILATSSFIALKLSDPYIFAPGNFLDPRPSPLFIENINALRLLSHSPSFPPAVQWINKIPIIFPLQNLVIFGLGIPVFILFLYGTLKALKERKFIFNAIIIWLAGFFIYQGTQQAATMRYFLILYPFIAILGGFGLYSLTKTISKKYLYLILIIIYIWPLMFLSIYARPHTRISATDWIHTNIPVGSTLLTEHWDDSLPLAGYSNYKFIQVSVFDPDTDEKWEKITDALEKGDYYILSSNRGWGSISGVPERYPKMAKFYKDLLSEKLEYKKVKEFTSYPSLEYLGIPITISDDFAEENFTVFDHPKVLIFKKSGR